MDNTCVVCRKLEIKIVWVVCHSSQSDFRFLSYDIHVQSRDKSLWTLHIGKQSPFL